jgi:hypothetical protein
MNAVIQKNLVPVKHDVRPEVQREFLTVECPAGWADVKKISRKVLSFEGKNFTFTGWNSDKNVAYFARPLNGEPAVAEIISASIAAKL